MPGSKRKLPMTRRALLAGGAAMSVLASRQAFAQSSTRRDREPLMSSIAPDNPPDPFPGHDGGRWAPVTGEVVAYWPQGHFAENAAVDAEGVVHVSLHSHHRIDRFDPQTRRAARASLASLRPR